MILKDLIRALFKLSGGQAMPSGDKVVMLSQNGPISQEFVAPNNGYFNFDARGTKTNVTYLQSNALVYSDSSLRHGLMVPVQKSERVIVYSGCDGLATLTFLRTVGGGLNSILESGGVLCLRLKNTLQKQWGFSPLSLSRVQRVESINLLLQTKETGLLLLPQQVGQWLKQTQSTFVSTTLQAVGEWLCVQQKEFRVTSPLQQFRLIKGTHWSGLFSRFLETEQDSTSTTPKLSNLSLCTQGGAL